MLKNAGLFLLLLTIFLAAAGCKRSTDTWEAMGSADPYQGGRAESERIGVISQL